MHSTAREKKAAPYPPAFLIRDPSSPHWASVELSRQLNAGSPEVTTQHPAGAAVVVIVVLDLVSVVVVVVVLP